MINTNIKKELIKYLVKQAQQEADQHKTSMDRLALKLVENLEKDYGISKDQNDPSSEVGSSGGVSQDIDIYPRDLKNLGALLTYLSSQKLTYGGKLIARVADGQPGEMDLKFGDVNVGARDQRTRQFGKQSFYADKKALKGYVYYLKKLAKDKKNKVLEIMIGSLLSEMNGYLGKEDKVDSNLDSSVFDSFFQPSISLDNPSDGSVNPITNQMIRFYPEKAEGAKSVLTAADLGSDTAFNRWMAANLASVLKDGKPIKTSDAGADCFVLNALNKRAQKYLVSAQSETAKATAQKYLQAVSAIAKAKQCVLSDTTGGDKDGGKDQDLYADKTPLDGFPGRIFAPNPMEQDQIIRDFKDIEKFQPVIRTGDLKTQPGFEEWMKKNNIRVDICTTIRRLYARANYYVQKSEGAFKTIAVFYKKALASLASIIKMQDGKACSLSGIPGDVGDKDGDGTGTGLDKDGRKKKSQSDLANEIEQGLKNVLANLPLQESQIDYGQIVTFYENLDNFYKSFSQVIGTQVRTYSAQVVHQFISRDINISSSGWNADTYSLGMGPREVIQAVSAKGLNKTFAPQILTANIDIVQHIISDLNNLRQRVSKMSGQIVEALQNGINNQIGQGTETAGGVGQRNIQKLQSTLARVNVMIGSR